MTKTEIKQLRSAFLKDNYQFMVNSLTPTRGYSIPVDNIAALIDSIIAKRTKKK
jgi:hypothetical protein